ncbi:transposase [Xanthomonas graminis pv. phlei]|nr:transposase [Xanthomonas translucens]UKE73757.1 transposase [Xanthomonas translucens pv. phleipratensis]
MTLNRIQFQKGLSIPAFRSRYGSEAQCVEALVQARWPDGFVCPQCGHSHASRFERGRQHLWQCARCRVQTSLTAGTPMADTKLPLRVWWLAIYLVSQAKNAVAALELARQLGVCYRTAWRIKHKVMAAMADREQSRRLDGEVQIDKVPFIAAVSLHRGRPRYLRLDVVSSFRFNLAAMVPRLASALAGAGRLTEQQLRTTAETQR